MKTTIETRKDQNGNTLLIPTTTHAGRTYRLDTRRHKICRADYGKTQGARVAAELLAGEIDAGTARPLSLDRAIERGAFTDNGCDMARRLVGPAEYAARLDCNDTYARFLKIASILSHADRLAPRFQRFAEYECNTPAEIDRPSVPIEQVRAATARHARNVARHDTAREKAEARILHALERVAPGRFVLTIEKDPRGAIVQAWDLSRVPAGLKYQETHCHAYASGVNYFRRQVVRNREKARRAA